MVGALKEDEEKRGMEGVEPRARKCSILETGNKEAFWDGGTSG